MSLIYRNILWLGNTAISSARPGIELAVSLSGSAMSLL